MLKLDALRAGYGPVEVLRGVTLEVPRGSVVALLGGNGAGKTTLMRALAGLIKLQGGAVTLDGEALHRLPAHRIFDRGVALVPQGRELFPDMTVAENLELGLLARPRTDTAPALIEGIFRLFPRLREKERTRAALLSGGEQQMLAMGRALIAKPQLLLLDEPTTGLAPIIVKELQRIIRQLSEGGQTILVVEHCREQMLDVDALVVPSRRERLGLAQGLL